MIRTLFLLLCLCGQMGCLGLSPVRKATQPLVNLTQRLSDDSLPDAEYQVHCPDQIEIRIANRPDLSGIFAIQPSGRIALPVLGNPRIEGHSCEAIRRELARSLQLPISTIQCRVLDYRSQHLFVFGPIIGPPRLVPYLGPERVSQLLQRLGGLNSDANLHEVRILRGNVAAGRPPSVQEVDLPAIVYQKDLQTDMVLQPYDEIHIGESRRSQIRKLLPDWWR